MWPFAPEHCEETALLTLEVPAFPCPEDSEFLILEFLRVDESQASPSSLSLMSQ